MFIAGNGAVTSREEQEEVMRRNKILHRLRKGEPVMLACPTPYPSPKLIEMIGLIGFDGVWIDMEHQDYDYDQLFAMGLACRASGMDPLVRMRKGPYWSYFRCLEAGANGIMVPHVCSAAEARDVVRNSRFHPVGQRGMDGVEVASNYGMEAMPEYMASANEETLVSIQIEDREGVEAIDEILAVEGLDGIMVGPADLTQSYGVPTQGGHPLIVQAVDRVAEACRRHGKWWGIPVASPEAARPYYEKGARFFVCGAAIIILQQGYSRIWKEFTETFRS